jgi:hypothetical protein
MSGYSYGSDAIRYVTDDSGTGPDYAIPTDIHSLADTGADAYVCLLSYFYRPGELCPGGDVGVVPDTAVVLDNCTRVDHDVLTDDSSRVNNCTGHNRRTWPDDCTLCNSGVLVHGGDKGVADRTRRIIKPFSGFQVANRANAKENMSYSGKEYLSKQTIIADDLCSKKLRAVEGWITIKQADDVVSLSRP